MYFDKSSLQSFEKLQSMISFYMYAWQNFFSSSIVWVMELKWIGYSSLTKYLAKNLNSTKKKKSFNKITKWNNKNNEQSSHESIVI